MGEGSLSLRRVILVGPAASVEQEPGRFGGNMRHAEFPNQDLVRPRDIAAACVFYPFENASGQSARGLRRVLQFAYVDDFRQRVCEVLGLRAVVGRVEPESQGPGEGED